MVWCDQNSMDLKEIEEHTLTAITSWKDAELTFSVIEKGGSGRLFIRIQNPATGESLIAMQYDLDRADNPRFASITDFLNRHNIPAPRILARRLDLNLLWVEDLGSTDLGNLAGEDWKTVRGPAYESALRTVFPLHQIHEVSAPPDLPELEKPFSESLYEWEQNYFLTHYVERFANKAAAQALRGDESFAALRRELASLPRALVHRDFQSTNVMLFKGGSYLIDYQGLRWGLAEYDLASLIYDPYSDFTPDETMNLISYYFSLMQEAGDSGSRADFEMRLTQCAMQRLMQAMGAYGFLSEVKGKTEFLNHIPTAKRRLLELATKAGGLPVLAGVLE